MVRKKKKRDAEQPPWCYYCDRVFSDESTLIQHQKAKHFKCTTCHRKLTSASGLRVHCHQVHRFTLDKVPAATPGRDSIELEVFGMSGVPEGAIPGAPLPEEEEPPSKAAKVQNTLSGQVHGFAMHPQLSLPPLAMPPPNLQPAPQLFAHIPPAGGAGYPPRATMPFPFPGAYEGVPPPWPPAAFLNSAGPPHMQGPQIQQRMGSIGVSQPLPPLAIPPAAPLFPIAAELGQGTFNGNNGVSGTAQGAAENPPARPPNQLEAMGVPPDLLSGSADDTSVEELRSRHAKYVSRGACTV